MLYAVLILGFTFKENCPDTRNSKVVDLIKELSEYGCELVIHDPVADADQAEAEYNLTLTPWGEIPQVDAIVAAVSHDFYLSMSLRDIRDKLPENGVFIDVKSAFDQEMIRQAGVNLWRL